MAFATYSVFSVIRGGEPINVIEVPGIALDFSGFVGQELESSGKQLKSELVPAEVINKPINLLAHVILMGFMVNVGFKISSLGVQFLRPIKVNLKEKGD